MNDAGMEKSHKAKSSRWAKYLLPALLAGFCAALYFLAPVSAKKEDAQQAEPVRLSAAGFMELAEGFGLREYERTDAQAYGVSYALWDGDESAELTLTLGEHGVEGFSLECGLPKLVKDGSEVLERLNDEALEKRAAWIRDAALACVRALEAGSGISAVDTDAFLLAVCSALSDKKARDGTVSGFDYGVTADDHAVYISVRAAKG